MKPGRTCTAVGFLLTFMMPPVLDASENATAAADGKTILQERCGRCHSIGKDGSSPLRHATPMRDIYRRYAIEQLEFELSEGVGSRHRDMPQIQFSSEQIRKILEYLHNIAGTN